MDSPRRGFITQTFDIFFLLAWKTCWINSWYETLDTMWPHFTILISFLPRTFVNIHRLVFMWATKISDTTDQNDLLQWRDGVLNHRRPGCLLNRLFMPRSKKTSRLRVTGHCEGNPPITGGSSYVENVSIWWRHHALCVMIYYWSVLVFSMSNHI